MSTTLDVSKLRVIAGRPYPTGPSVCENGMRFTIFARNATRVWLALFAKIEDITPIKEFEFDPIHNRTGDMWSIFVHGLTEGALYKYRMGGPFDAAAGHRYDAATYILDPYAKAFVGDVHDGTMKCVTVRESMDWEKGTPPRIPMRDTIIYEAHVRGFTQDPSSGVAQGGTYEGLIEKIPYLQHLGITAVELLPIQEFGENLLGRCSMDTQEELTNYWGYSSIGFFAPAGRYASSTLDLAHVDQFRRMVQALHDANIEVILDVVFNHTSEGNEHGPTLCFRGIDNSIYYLLENGEYLNYSGCGNTVNCDHPLVRDFILDCLRYWTAVMHVDGFRFDLASILGRDQYGNVQTDAPLIRRIAEDPVLRDVKLIAEAWDAGGAYQVGSFGGVRWAEWNGRYRDDVRRYWCGEAGTQADFASRLMGSANLYQWADRTPEHSINFITCHDGFTLRDLVSYREKHNLANGDGNRDGDNNNHSMNFGIEGETDDTEISALRLRMQKNYLATLFLSLGVPMLLAGDEFSRTQQGNNNAYCQDSELSWLDWRLLEKNKEIHRFCKSMIAFRKAHPAFTRVHYYHGQPDNGNAKDTDLLWYNAAGHPVDWHGQDTALACHIAPESNDTDNWYLMFNNSNTALSFVLPKGSWRQCIHTGKPAPQDITLDLAKCAQVRRTLELPSASLAVLCAMP